ncbi:MAG: hypothetical protein AAFO06_13105 [Cyanobacteria bacterium J06597_16]
MTKKRIADLLKEEVEKPAQAASSAKGRGRKRPSAKAASTSTAAKSAAAKSAKSKSTAAKSAAAKSTAAKSTKSTAASRTASKATSKTTAKPAATKASAAKASATKNESAALAKKVAQLEAALNESAAQVSALQEDVETHQNRVFELKDSLEATERESKKKDSQLKKLTAELADAKQVILDLSEAAAKNKAAAKAGLATTKQKTATPAKTPAARSLSVQRRPYSSYKSIPEYAIQRGTPLGGQSNSMMDDDDIGWVD